MSRSFFKILSAIIVALSLFQGSMAQKVFMTGDSHVYAKVYPETIEQLLSTAHPGMQFGWWAKNGICFYSFNSNPEYFDSIFKFKPDILIVHLGTNGAYANNFTRRDFRKEMEIFYSTVTDSLPDVKVVFVTPFTNKKRKNKKKGRWHVNNKNRDVADEIIAFTNDHSNTFVIDNNAEVGMKFLKSPALIRPDNVHLTEEGYRELGNMVSKEILALDSLWTPNP